MSVWAWPGTTSTMTTTTTMSRLSLREVGASAALGATLWYVGTLLIKYGRPMGIFDRAVLPLNFAISAGGVAPATVLVVSKMTGLRGDPLVLSMAVGTGVALVLDSLGFTYGHKALYGLDSPNEVPIPSAWILWAGGWGLLAAQALAMLGTSTVTKTD